MKIATNFTDARNDLKRYCDIATDDFETIIITCKEKAYTKTRKRVLNAKDTIKGLANRKSLNANIRACVAEG